MAVITLYFLAVSISLVRRTPDATTVSPALGAASVLVG